MNMRWQVGIGMAGMSVIAVISTWQRWPWYAGTVAIGAILLYLLLTAYESLAADPKYAVFVASLSAIAAVSRTAMQGIPGVQPATFFVIVTGYSLGPVTGAAVGAFTAVGSNLFLGEGGWTPWQMLAWGLVGLTAGLIRRVRPGLPIRWLVPFGIGWGYLFGWIMNTWVLLSGSSIQWKTYIALCISSFWMDTMHAVATGMFLALAGAGVFRILERFRKKLVVTQSD